MKHLLLPALLVLSVAACSGKSDGDTSPDSPSTTDDGGADDTSSGDDGTGDDGTGDDGTGDDGTGDDGTGDDGTGDKGGDTDTGTGDTQPPPPADYHPDGFKDPAVHGIEAKFQQDACTACHGEDLSGGTAKISCDTCHESGWRTDCTFCHGGVENSTGAPPQSIDDSEEDLSFGAHTAHVTDGLTHVAFGCEQCHAVPTDVLTEGHFMVGDATAGEAELDFSAGLSDAATYLGAASCANLYCHGNGQGDNGEWSVAEGDPSCDSCHPSMSSAREVVATMSGEHGEHINHGIGCHDCHGDTVERTDDAIKDITLHVNGVVDIALEEGIEFDAKTRTCAGECHRETHLDRRWD
jgi:predicted CxxxxCH...CXXCH cytochrome family protein